MYPEQDGLPLKPLNANYQIQDVLGKGTFGKVYKCVETSNSRRVVAVKRLVKKLDPGISPQRLREVNFYKNVPPQTNLVELLDMFIDTEGGTVCFAMEIMSGSLMSLINCYTMHHKRIISPFSVAKIARDILSGVAHIHAHGYVHRDIKPENILYSGRGSTTVIKLTDFGLSKHNSVSEAHNTKWTGYVATRWYRAPEQLLELDNHGYPLDVWSVCTILYELCNLAPLFPGGNCTEMLRKQYKVLGYPSRNSRGGLAPAVSAKLQGNPLFNPTYPGLTTCEEVMNDEKHDIYVSVIFDGLKWDPLARATAQELLDQINLILNAERIKFNDKFSTYY